MEIILNIILGVAGANKQSNQPQVILLFNNIIKNDWEILRKILEINSSTPKFLTKAIEELEINKRIHLNANAVDLSSMQNSHSYVVAINRVPTHIMHLLTNLTDGSPVFEGANSFTVLSFYEKSLKAYCPLPSRDMLFNQPSMCEEVNWHKSDFLLNKFSMIFAPNSTGTAVEPKNDRILFAAEQMYAAEKCENSPVSLSCQFYNPNISKMASAMAGRSVNSFFYGFTEKAVKRICMKFSDNKLCADMAGKTISNLMQISWENYSLTMAALLFLPDAFLLSLPNTVSDKYIKHMKNIITMGILACMLNDIFYADDAAFFTASTIALIASSLFGNWFGQAVGENFISRVPAMSDTSNVHLSRFRR